MDYALLPNFCALLVFIGAFRPLARRAGPHVNAWFLGWTFLLLNSGLLLVISATNGRFLWITLISQWALELGGICFLRAAASAPRTVPSVALTAEMVLPIFALATLVVLHVHSPMLQALCTLLLVAPGIHLVFQPREQTRVRIQMAWGFAITAFCLAPFAAFDPALALAILHCLLFIGSAIFYWDYSSRPTPGVFIAVGGMSLWGLMHPINLLLQRLGVASPILTAIWQIPSYVVAYGMILTLIEEHVRRTEALALHDPLTHLPNRRLFDDRLEQALAVAPSTGTILACVVIDVDRFKQINDTLGHATGDGLLEAVAQRLSWHIRPGDTLARTGGDEFAAVLPRMQSLEHLRFTVGALMSATSAPIIVGEHSIDLGLSVGIAIYPDAATDADGLRRRADDAMYEAKRTGGNRFAYAGGPPDELARLLVALPEDTRLRLPENEPLRLHQPELTC